MGKLDQLRKMQEKQQTSALDLLQNESEENIFDEEVVKEEKKEPEQVKEEAVKKEKVKKEPEPKTKAVKKKETVTDEKKDVVTEEETTVRKDGIKLVQPVKSKKHNVVLPETHYKTGTIRVPEELFLKMEAIINKTNGLTYTSFANQSISNCLNAGYGKMMHYNEQKLVVKSKNDNFNLFASPVQKTIYKAIPFNISIEQYKEAIKVVSENESIASMNDFFIDCIYTQLEYCKA